MIEKVDANEIKNLLENLSAKPSGTAGTAADDQADASLQVNYDSLIENSKQVPQPDPTAVQKARQLLLSGQLESEENFQAAAEEIGESGI